MFQYGGDQLLGDMDQTDQTVAHYAARTGNTMVTILTISKKEGKANAHIENLNDIIATVAIWVS